MGKYSGQYKFTIYARLEGVTKKLTVDVLEEEALLPEEWDALPTEDQQIAVDSLFATYFSLVCDVGIYPELN